MKHDENAICVYLWHNEGREAGLVDIKISKLIKQFLNADKNHVLMTTVVRKRKREVGLVIIAKYSTMYSLKGRKSINILKCYLRV